MKISELIVYLQQFDPDFDISTVVRTEDTISQYTRERINKWKELTKLMKEADDNTKCPICKEQFIDCGCLLELSQDIMESLFYKEIKISEK